MKSTPAKKKWLFDEVTQYNAAAATAAVSDKLKESKNRELLSVRYYQNHSFRADGFFFPVFFE